ncbi:hypothetical protein B0T24DRAFT_589318 [Lasiosphaeria ovina]|uniref:Uncharacterized protein n=1 Tax=Lasiosphaeria ovina TaxID=92902 RepID=A0AAE0NDF0_9PEZI|nr:hypothetical protein B0T24DRAFT_589318 [Lasiosphaeria ovina]
MAARPKVASIQSPNGPWQVREDSSFYPFHFARWFLSRPVADLLDLYRNDEWVVFSSLHLFTLHDIVTLTPGFPYYHTAGITGRISPDEILSTIGGAGLMATLLTVCPFARGDDRVDLNFRRLMRLSTT